MRANDDFTSKDFVLGGSYNTTYESGAYIVEMKLTVRITKSSDLGVYKCIAKNALGNSEETIKILCKFFPLQLVPLKSDLRFFESDFKKKGVDTKLLIKYI